MCSSPTSARDRVMAMVWYEIKKILLRPSCQVALLLLLLLSGRFCVVPENPHGDVPEVVAGVESCLYFGRNNFELGRVRVQPQHFFAL